MLLHEEFWDVINAEQCEHIDHMKDNPFPVYQKNMGRYDTMVVVPHEGKKFETRR
jgi:nitrous oxide reductase accessory protein NosL